MTCCRVCGHDGEATLHQAREMMFGRGGSYTYRECPVCGTLQLLNVPDDLSAHYPPDYYSYDAGRRPRWEMLTTWLKMRRGKAHLGGGDLLGSLVLRRTGPSHNLLWLERLGLGLDATILDVGCGHGELLMEMQRDGCRHLTGADPFVDAEIDHGAGLRILKTDLGGLNGAWDLIMLHHSFEHMPDPVGTFTDLARLTAPGGHVLIRVPLADSAAWRRYGVDWVQLDAPRHLFLFTNDAVGRLAAGSGFRIDAVDYDSTAFQFWGSEQYRRGIPLRGTGSHGSDAADPLFTPGEIAAWSDDALRLNNAGEGDQAAFFLSRI